MKQYNGNNSTFIVLTAVLGSIATLSVILRFVSRAKTKANFGADDWLAILALILLYAYMGMALWSGENGAGYDPLTLPPHVLVAYLKAVYVGGVLAPATITAAKFSVLYFYHRLFSTDKQFRVSVNAVGILCAAWYFAATIGILLKCVPIAKSWDVALPGYCFNISDFAVAIEVPNSLLDFVVVALPVRVIKQLHLSLQQKVTISVAFVLGGFVGIIGFIRIAINYNPDSFSNLILEFGYWFNLDSLLSAAASQPIDRSSQRANSWPGLRVSYQNCLAKATYTGCRYQVQGRRALKRVVLSGLGTIDMTTATIMAIR